MKLLSSPGIRVGALLLGALLAVGCVVGASEVAEQEFEAVRARSQMVDPDPASAVCPEGPCIATELLAVANGESVASILWNVDTATGEITSAGQTTRIEVTERSGLTLNEANELGYETWAGMQELAATSTPEDEPYGIVCTVHDMRRQSLCCACWVTVCVVTYAGGGGYTSVTPACGSTGDCRSGYSSCSPYTNA